MTVAGLEAGGRPGDPSPLDRDPSRPQRRRASLAATTSPSCTGASRPLTSTQGRRLQGFEEELAVDELLGDGHDRPPMSPRVVA